MSSSGECACLVARAIPLPADSAENNQRQKKAVLMDSLADQLADISLDAAKTKTTKTEPKLASEAKKPPRDSTVSPRDFVNLQSLRSSALARKTNTTSKFSRDCRNLFADLMQQNGGSDEVKAEMKASVAEKAAEAKAKKVEEKEEKSVEKVMPEKATEKAGKGLVDPKASDSSAKSASGDKEEDAKKDEELIARGPVRVCSRNPATVFHPYPSSVASSTCDSLPYHATAPQTTVFDPSSYNPNNAAFNFGYDCGVQANGGEGYGEGYYWDSNSCEVLSTSSTPDTVGSLDAMGYGSYGTANTPPQTDIGIQQQFTYPPGTVGYLTIVQQQQHNNTTATATLNNGGYACVDSPCTTDDRNELPDALSDFILKYSRRYTPSPDGGRKGSFSGDDADTAYTGSPYSTVSSDRNGDSTCNSPLNTPAHSSPAAPRAGLGDPNSPPMAGGQRKFQLPKQNSSDSGVVASANLQPSTTSIRPAKDHLRTLIRNDEMDESWAWTCKCMQHHPGALTFQDGDKDTLLHIVSQHMDLAKIYALVEQMLKMEELRTAGDSPPFDIQNAMGETPLFLAVEKRQNEIVDYLIEAGASPNTQNCRFERDAPLHYAATRGMTNIVQTLCSYSTTKMNQLNGMGLTPLLCAFKNHGILEEESQNIISNLGVIKVLIKSGADAAIPDGTNGKTLVHYAVEKMDVQLIETLRANLDDASMTALVNQADHSGDTPMKYLETSVVPELRSELCLALMTCGGSPQREG